MCWKYFVKNTPTLHNRKGFYALKLSQIILFLCGWLWSEYPKALNIKKLYDSPVLTLSPSSWRIKGTLSEISLRVFVSGSPPCPTPHPSLPALVYLSSTLLAPFFVFCQCHVILLANVARKGRRFSPLLWATGWWNICMSPLDFSQRRASVIAFVSIHEI